MERKFLEDLGLDKETVDKIMAENASDIEAEKGKFDAERTTLQGQISDLQGQVTQRDTDLAGLNEKLTAAGGGNVQINMRLNEKDDDKGDAE